MGGLGISSRFGPLGQRLTLCDRCYIEGFACIYWEKGSQRNPDTKVNVGTAVLGLAWNHSQGQQTAVG